MIRTKRPFLGRRLILENEDNTIRIVRLRTKKTMAPAAPRDEKQLTGESVAHYRNPWTRTAGDVSLQPVAKPSRHEIELAIEWAHLGGD
jgi:hypothetical protein